VLACLQRAKQTVINVSLPQYLYEITIQDGNPKKKGKDDEWIFGLKDAWILAPEREGAHNWEGTGYDTAYRSLQVLQALTTKIGSESTKKQWITNYKADVSRVLYAGHSRGGHGALIMATLVPDLALGVVTASGWIKREVYGDANIIFHLDTSMSHLDPQLKWIMESTIIERDTAQMVSNIKGKLLIRM
jgi:hypothetical protein